MSEHTPGPWEYLGHAWVQTADDKKTPIANFNFFAATEANARLIAAAPELLEALRMFVVWYGLRDKHDTLLPPKQQEAELAQAMRAIAKATGAPE